MPQSPLFIYYVHDMERALTFYEKGVGLKIASRSPGWSTLDLDGATLALHILSSGSEESTTPHAGLNLQVNDIEAGIQQVENAGGKLKILQPADKFVPDHVARLEDTEGNGFELRQPGS